MTYRELFRKEEKDTRIMVYVSSNYTILSLNAVAETFFGCLNQDVVGNSIFQFALNNNLILPFIKNNSVHCEHDYRYEIIPDVCYEQEKDAFLILGKQLHDSNRAAHIYLKNILMHIPGSVYWKDKNGVYLGCNKFQAKIVGLNSPEELLGKTDYDLSWKNMADILRETDQRIMETGVSEELLETDGRGFTALTSKAPLYDEKGRIIGIIGVSVDMTNLRKAEERERIVRAEAEDLKAKTREEKKIRKALMIVAGAIAHEMRTPLMGIAAEARWLKKVMPTLLEAYQFAIQSSDIAITPISPNLLTALPQVSEGLEKTTRNAFTIIDMLLMNLKDNPSGDHLEICSINDCLAESLSAYPFEEEEKKLIHWERNQDFYFKGNHLLIQHVFFNLIKNALFYGKKSQNAEIFIRIEQGQEKNILRFKDTGIGVSDDILPHIFERFFSQTIHGTGIGLAFCKMVMEGLGGDITCDSVEGEFTEFALSFPKIATDQ